MQVTKGIKRKSLNKKSKYISLKSIKLNALFYSTSPAFTYEYTALCRVFE